MLAGVPAILVIRMGLPWKLRTLDKPFGFLVRTTFGVKFAEISFQNYLVNWVIYYTDRTGIRIRFTWVI